MEWLQKASSFIDTIDKATSKSLTTAQQDDVSPQKSTDVDSDDHNDHEVGTDDIGVIEEQGEEIEEEEDDNDKHDEHGNTIISNITADTTHNHNDDDDERDSNHNIVSSSPVAADAVTDSISSASKDDAHNKSNDDTNINDDDQQPAIDNDVDTQPQPPLQSQPTQSSAPAVDSTAPHASIIDSKPAYASTKKQRHKKKKKSKPKTSNNNATTNTNATVTTTSSNTTDYQQLKKQYEGMVALWNEERSNLKKAQQLLRNQKNTFTTQQQSLIDEHEQQLSALKHDFEQQLSAKQATFNALESNLLQVKQERNHTIESGESLRAQIAELEAEKLSILSEKSQLCIDKQQQMQLLRNEFEQERTRWEKEREILTKNIDHESILQTENVENTNALARTQASLQQKELENTRLKGELKWLKQDKENLMQNMEMMQEQHDNVQRQLEQLQVKLSETQQEMAQLKSEHNEQLMAEQKKLVSVTQELEQLRLEWQGQQAHANGVVIMEKQKKKNESGLNARIKDLTHSLLEKQTELDACVSKKNELRMKVSKLEEEILAITGGGGGGSGVNRNKKEEVDVESGGLLSKRNIFAALSRSKSGSDLSTSRGVMMKRKSFTSYKSIDSGLAVFDRIGLEFTHVLRNKPWIRLLVVMYIIVLHLWCGLVLHFSMNHVEDDKH
mmetsp:Transcript_2756/g.5197  ORF Transcript_2756/g.5197 Transcript_2756/m.5197 type:complete len:671 (+) Transcript_2756:32-2044(+)|eukprot:CAMPEP_0202695108 /NCGR_PEP_ID=MMETSP1385-20130828/8781_1 /ASSEMBLY_ACC=CAM_ASM_000861 /TAXON_ID=933848 /ORGANISM="Elphidium margaritaceum" /LENGTH=670 /DNA_ID=CAMNT_0049351071 /DNA_START=32 /DNA_END=2044 /DNA_ORIENTATION=-